MINENLLLVICLAVMWLLGVWSGWSMCQRDTKVGNPSASHNSAMLKLPEFIEVYNEANRINGRHIENGTYAIVKGCYEFIVRQLQQ